MAHPRRNLSELGKLCSGNVKIFDILDCKAMATPMDTNLKLLSEESSELVDMNQYKYITGSLMYLMNPRPDICFSMNTLSQYLGNPRYVHLIILNHVMRYLKGRPDMGHYYGRDHDYRLYGYTNSDWARDVADMKSTSGGCYCLGSTMISCFSKKQSSVSLNMPEAEYITSCYASCEAIWLRNMMSGLFDLVLDTTVILNDNQSCINMT